jgi:hypothetical protein
MTSWRHTDLRTGCRVCYDQHRHVPDCWVLSVGVGVHASDTRCVCKLRQLMSIYPPRGSDRLGGTKPPDATCDIRVCKGCMLAGFELHLEHLHPITQGVWRLQQCWLLQSTCSPSGGHVWGVVSGTQATCDPHAAIAEPLALTQQSSCQHSAVTLRGRQHGCRRKWWLALVCSTLQCDHRCTGGRCITSIACR